MDIDLTELTDLELIEHTAALIYSDACLQSKGFGFPREEALESATEECQRRTPNYHLYTRAYNLASDGIVSRSEVPADPRIELAHA